MDLRRETPVHFRTTCTGLLRGDAGQKLSNLIRLPHELTRLDTNTMTEAKLDAKVRAACSHAPFGRPSACPPHAQGPFPSRTAPKVRASNSPCLADMERAQCAWHSFGMSFTATITIGDPSHPEPQEGLPVDRLPDAFVTPEDARRAAQEHIEQLRSRGLDGFYRVFGEDGTEILS